MLIEFTVKNYRSFRDEATLSMEDVYKRQEKPYLIDYIRIVTVLWVLFEAVIRIVKQAS